MILASGARGPGLNSRSIPCAVLFLCRERQQRGRRGWAGAGRRPRATERDGRGCSGQNLCDSDDQDTLPEWSKGVDSSSTSASCVGLKSHRCHVSLWPPISASADRGRRRPCSPRAALMSPSSPRAAAFALTSKGTWRSGITPARHAGGPGPSPPTPRCTVVANGSACATCNLAAEAMLCATGPPSIARPCEPAQVAGTPRFQTSDWSHSSAG